MKLEKVRSISFIGLFLSFCAIIALNNPVLKTDYSNICVPLNLPEKIIITIILISLVTLGIFIYNLKTKVLSKIYTWSNNTVSCNFNIFSKYRSILSCAAIVAIVWHHLPGGTFICVGGSFTLEYISTFLQFIGDIGVDIFIFISGLGIYYSLTKNNNPAQFYKKRALRIIPINIISVILAVLFFCNMTRAQFLGNILMIGQWFDIGFQLFWFIQLIIILYLLSPIFFKIINRYSGLLLTFLGLLIITILNYIIIGKSDWIIATTRIPTYLLGMYIGQLSLKKQTIPLLLEGILIFFAITGAVLLWWFVNEVDPTLYAVQASGLKYYTYFMMVPGVAIVITRIAQLIECHSQFIFSILNIIGTHTIGIYLSHIVLIQGGFSQWFSTIVLEDTPMMKLFSWTLALIILVIIGVVYEILINKLEEASRILIKT